MERTEILAGLIAAGARIDVANLYCDAFLEYREASENIARNGLICSDPRTGKAMQNPYLSVRNGALKKLNDRSLRRVKADFLWSTRGGLA